MSITTNTLGPLDPDTMRVIFLYVGQGESTLVLMPDGTGGHLSMLIDCNRGVAQKGMDLSKLLGDVLPTNDAGTPVLDVFANTHPHSDHLGGLGDIRERIEVGAVWHSGHKPGAAHEGPYGELNKLIKEVEGRGGEERKLIGSKTAIPWGAGEIHVLSPAEYIVEEIEEGSADDRYARIHDQCAVLRISYGTGDQKTRVLITGDSDKKAWMRITEYHGKPNDNRVKANVLSASHHGSYTFFKDSQDDANPYEDHLKAISPDRIVISAPDQKDSKHNHPDDDALRRYQNAVGTKSVHHMGSRGWSFVVDAYADGTHSILEDRGDLAREFALDDDGGDDDNDGGGTPAKRKAPAVVSRVERSRTMGAA